MPKLPPFVAYDTDNPDAEPQWMDELPDDAQFIIVVGLTVPLLLSDNLVGVCAGCGRPVQFRPEGAGPIPKVCYRCAEDWALGVGRPQ